MASITIKSKVFFSKVMSILGDKVVGASVLQSDVSGFSTDREEVDEFLAASSVLLGTSISSLSSSDGSKILKQMYRKFPEKRVKAFLEATTYSTERQFFQKVEGDFPDLSCTVTCAWQRNRASSESPCH